MGGVVATLFGYLYVVLTNEDYALPDRLDRCSWCSAPSCT